MNRKWLVRCFGIGIAITGQASTPQPAPLRLFYSYCHKDEAMRDDLETHLALLRREGVIASWHDRQIIAGQEWKGQINRHLNEADIILLLISADFLPPTIAIRLRCNAPWSVIKRGRPA